MIVAFLGNFRVDFTSETHYLKSLVALGHTVLRLQETDPITPAIMKQLEMCDMFFWVHTHKWETPGLEGALQLMKALNKPIVGYHLDLWLGLKREEDLKNDNYWKWMDIFFSVDKLMVDWLNEKHAAGEKYPRAAFLPAGVFGEECEIREKDEPFLYDVIFVGSKSYHSEWLYRAKLINWLQDTYGKRFKLVGREEGKPFEQVRGKELNELYARSKVVIGDTLCKEFNYPYYLSDRVFETVGRGGFIIHPFIKGIEELFVLPKPYASRAKPEVSYVETMLLDTTEAELVTYPFNNFEYLKYLIDYFLTNEEEREAIRTRGNKRVRREHTYSHRLSYLLKTVNELWKTQSTDSKAEK